MKDFIDKAQKSIYNPEYYHELLTRPKGYSWKYYWSLALLLAVFMTVVSSLPLVPTINKVLREFPGSFLAYYPDELEVNINQGIVSPNVNEPYYLPIPQKWSMPIATTSNMLYLGVIDTKTPVSLEQFEAYKAAFWISGNALVVKDQDGSVRISKFGPTVSYVINEENLHGILDRVEPYFRFVAPVVVLAIFVGMILSFVLNLAYLLFGALLVFILGHVIKQKWSYGTSYRLCLHASTLPLLVGLALSILPLGVVDVPLLSTALLVGVVYANFRHTPPVHEAPTPPTVA